MQEVTGRRAIAGEKGQKRGETGKQETRLRAFAIFLSGSNYSNYSLSLQFNNSLQISFSVFFLRSFSVCCCPPSIPSSASASIRNNNNNSSSSSSSSVNSSNNNHNKNNNRPAYHLVSAPRTECVLCVTRVCCRNTQRPKRGLSFSFAPTRSLIPARGLFLLLLAICIGWLRNSVWKVA